MQQSFSYPREYRGAYDYNIQATEDREELAIRGAAWGQGTPVWRPGGTPNYRPIPLRWPYISTVIALLLAAIVLVIVADRKMPDSDSNAIFLGLQPNATQPVRLARDVFINNSSSSTTETATAGVPISTTVAVVSTTASQTPLGGSSTSEGLRVLAQGQSTSASSSQVSVSTQKSAQNAPLAPPPASSVPPAGGTETGTVSTKPTHTAASTGMNANVNAVVPSSTSSTSTPSASTSHPGGRTDVAVGTVPVFAFTSSSTSTSSPSASTLHGGGRTDITLGTESLVAITNAPTSTSSTASLPSGARLVPISTSISYFTRNITMVASTFVSTSVITVVSTVPFDIPTVITSSIVSTVTSLEISTFRSYFTANGTTSTAHLTSTHTQILPTTIFLTITSGIEGVSTFSSLATVTETGTITGVVIPSVGEVTVTYYSTVLPPPVAVVTQSVGPVQVTGVQVVDGTTVAVVETQAPIVVVASPSNVVETEVGGQQVTTGVVAVAGPVVTSVVVFTPSVAGPVNVVTTVGGTPVTVVNTPDPVTAVTVINGVQRTVVETPPPQTVVRTEGGVPTTIAAGQPFTETIVNTVGGTPVTNVVVTTPAGPPYQPISYTVVSDAGGTLVTEVIVTTPTGPPGQPITYTEVSNVGGTPVTEVVVTTLGAAAFQPVSYTITTDIGGTPTVITVTPSPTTTVETINGTPVTRIITPPLSSYTTTVGGTLTTEVIVTTPTGTGPITLTLVSTEGSTFRTFTSTVPPSTFLTTISGTPRTITSTPPPNTSFSTRAKSTHTFTSTLTPTASTTTTANDPSDPHPSIVASTVVYSWTQADIFLGTFLPPLLAVALVIPLRIIDLNAKLYQPFQSLARPGGAPGAETLLLQYTGLMAWVTPVVTLLQGAPVPFLTTLVVGAASFMVPLATEAVGLKLHGACYLNTASPTCGPALGVSPVPAYVLAGLIGVVVVLLLVVMVLVGRWVTGVNADPWNLAGAASLAGNPAVRVRQGDGKAMRRAVADKQYGLGFFLNAAGREEYGIVLMDEAGRGLHERRHEEGHEGDSDSEVLNVEAEMAKWNNWGGGFKGTQQLPLMPLRYPWRIAFFLFQLALLVFIIYYHAYYRGGIRDNGRLWQFLNANTFGVRFVSAVIGVVIAFCWQSFFLSVSTITPFHLLSLQTQPARTSILLTPHTNPFSGLFHYTALLFTSGNRSSGSSIASTGTGTGTNPPGASTRSSFLFPAATALAAALSEFLPVVLSNVPFNLAQTSTAATACAVLSCAALAGFLAVLATSFFVRYPPLPADPRCVAGLMWYVSESRGLLADFGAVAGAGGGGGGGLAGLGGKERERRVGEMGRRYYYGVLPGYGAGEGGHAGRRLGVDCDVGGGGGGDGEEDLGYRGAAGVREGWTPGGGYD